LQSYFDGIDKLAAVGQTITEDKILTLKGLWDLKGMDFKGLQKKLSVKLYQIRMDNLQKELQNRDDGLLSMKLFTSAKGFLASAWLFTIPTSTSLRMSPTQFSIALRNRLFVPHPSIHDSIRCACDQRYIDVLGHHVHCCNSFSGYRISTHNAILDTLGNMLHNAGILCKKEYVLAKEKRYDKDKLLIGDNDKRRLDLVTKLPVSLLDESTTKVTSIDVTVVNAARNSKNLTLDSATTIAFEANKQETLKINKYQDLADVHDNHILPFAIEAQGQYGSN
jgi:hypothetical protein